MADIVSAAQRSRMMGRIGGRDTKPEIAVRRVLFARGFRYRLHAKRLPGRPDIVLRKWNAVVLVHGFCATSRDPTVVAVADELHAAQLDVVSYDARGHGRSEGHPTLGDLEQYDVAAAVALARERADDVVLVGASMGI